MKKVHVLYYSWIDQYSGERYQNYEAFGSRKEAEHRREFVLRNYDPIDLELVTLNVN